MSISKSDELPILAHVLGNNPKFRELLLEKRRFAEKHLLEAADLHAIYRAQGRITLLDELLSPLANAR